MSLKFFFVNGMPQSVHLWPLDQSQDKKTEKKLWPMREQDDTFSV